MLESPFNKAAVLQACNFIKKGTLAQVLFCVFCEISKNTFFTEHFRTTASVIRRLITLSPFKVEFISLYLFELFLFIFIGGTHQLLLLRKTPVKLLKQLIPLTL